jgi:transcriptional regulator with GAF, ATPase, and Fis domain
VNPRLQAVAGPLKDSIFNLETSETTVGRDAGNVLSINDPSVSRHHCVLRLEQDSYVIRDLKSRNGTYVNAVDVHESRLNHGDQLSIGDSVFLFLVHEEAKGAATPSPVEFDDKATLATAQLRPQEVLYLHPERIQNELPTTSRLGRNLNVLLKISRAVHSVEDLDQLQARILELIFEVVPAERGAILLDGKGIDNLSSIFARHRVPERSQPVRVSRTVARQVLEQGVAILGTDVPQNSGLREVESLLSSHVRSLLCVPLSVLQKVIGCIYLDTTLSGGRFENDDLELVAGIAGICAAALENARRLQWLEQENLRLTTEINLEHNMVGESACMKELYQLLSRVSPRETTVLIEGESGTGKELAARAIHRNSQRSKGPFVAINCAAIPEGLLESELFGHERGAFTGAITQKKGRLELAQGGVLFLDEIGELAPALQVKLLRVLQEREFERLGGTRPISIDVRLIAATNKNLEEAVKAKTFREDLYYRLNVVSLVMPALRERRDDIPLLAGYFINKFAAKCKVKPKTFSRDAMACLTHYDWPGNVRELENAIERALVLGVAEVIQPEDLPESVLEKDPGPEIARAKYHTAVKELKKRLIVSTLEEKKGNFTEAAHALGLHPNYLHRLMRNLGLRGAAPRPISVVRSKPKASERRR